MDEASEIVPFQEPENKQTRNRLQAFLEYRRASKEYRKASDIVSQRYKEQMYDRYDSEGKLMPQQEFLAGIKTGESG